jgi:hypothetical protein
LLSKKYLICINFNYIDYDIRRRLLQHPKGASIIDNSTIEKLYLDLIEAQGAALRAKKLYENKEPLFETFELVQSILSITRDYHNIHLNRKMQSLVLHEGTFFPRKISGIVRNPPKGN